jgi:hypothetical protein
MALTERYVTSAAGGGGDGTVGSPWTLAEAAAAAVAGDRINVKADAAYTVGATLAPANSGDVTNGPIIWRGYTTNIGDGDQGRTGGTGALVTTNMPVLNFSSTYYLSLPAKVLHVFEALVINVNSTVAAINLGASCAVKQCVLTNGANNAAAYGVKLIAGGVVFDSDIFTTHGTASGPCVSIEALGAKVIGCRIKSSMSSGVVVASSAGTILNNLIYECGTYGVHCNVAASSEHLIYGNTIVRCTLDAIKIADLLADDLLAIINNHCTDNGESFYDNAYSATGVLPAFISHNRTRDNASADNGLGNWPIYDAVTTDNNIGGDYVDYTTDDYRLISAAPGKATGHMPSQDIGCFQRAEPTYPVAGDVDSTAAAYGDTVSQTTPTCVLPAEADVETGVQYGAGGTEFEGTLSGSGGLLTHGGMTGNMNG